MKTSQACARWQTAPGGLAFEESDCKGPVRTVQHQLSYKTLLCWGSCSIVWGWLFWPTIFRCSGLVGRTHRHGDSAGTQGGPRAWWERTIKTGGVHAPFLLPRS